MCAFRYSDCRDTDYTTRGIILLSIVPVKDKETRLIILPSYKMKDVDVTSRLSTVSLNTRNVNNVEKALANCREERLRLSEIINMGSDKVLSEKVTHQDIIIDSLKLYCPLIYTDIIFNTCIAKRKRKDCNRLCTFANSFIRI